MALFLALHQQNFAACMEGWGECDHSKLTAQEAKTISVTGGGVSKIAGIAKTTGPPGQSYCAGNDESQNK